MFCYLSQWGAGVPNTHCSVLCWQTCHLPQESCFSNTEWQCLATEVMLHITLMGDVTQWLLSQQSTAAMLPTVSHPHYHMSKCPAKERLHSSDHNGVDIWRESNLNELLLALPQEWKAWQQWGCSGQVLRDGKKRRMFITCECCLDQMKQWCHGGGDTSAD